MLRGQVCAAVATRLLGLLDGGSTRGTVASWGEGGNNKIVVEIDGWVDMDAMQWDGMQCLRAMRFFMYSFFLTGMDGADLVP